MPLALLMLAASPSQAVELLGIKLVGVNSDTGKKLLFSLILIFGLWAGSAAIRAAAKAMLKGHRNIRARFWMHQVINIALAVLLIIGLLSVWFDNADRFATFFGLVSAGVAFALQRVITSIAAYFVLLRGKTFRVGDRIVMGGVRGDVIALDFIQTTIMEMGQPPDLSDSGNQAWIHGRQYTGRIVTITNDKIFDDPVFNYTREFPYIWDEMTIPVPYTADRGRAESAILEIAGKHTIQQSALTEDALKELGRRYYMKASDVGPKVYYRLTDNWIEMSLRFVVREDESRKVKDAMSRDLIRALEEAGIQIASSTYDIVGMPTLKVVQENPS